MSRFLRRFLRARSEFEAAAGLSWDSGVIAPLPFKKKCKRSEWTGFLHRNRRHVNRFHAADVCPLSSNPEGDDSISSTAIQVGATGKNAEPVSRADLRRTLALTKNKRRALLHCTGPHLCKWQVSLKRDTTLQNLQLVPKKASLHFGFTPPFCSF